MPGNAFSGNATSALNLFDRLMHRIDEISGH